MNGAFSPADTILQYQSDILLKGLTRPIQSLQYFMIYEICPKEINVDIQLLYLMCQFMQIIIQHCFQLD